MEIKTRPDAPGLWQRKSDRRVFLWNGKNWTSHIEFAWHSLSFFTPDTYRLIVDINNKLVCDPQSPWPKEPKVEKRRLVLYRDELLNVQVLILSECLDTRIRDRRSLLDELRDCEVNEHGVVIRVLPAQ